MARVRGDRRITVFVRAVVDGGNTIEETKDAVIPSDYDAADVRALTARVVEDTAFVLLRREFGRAPTKAALIAYAARQRGIEVTLDEVGDDPDTLRSRIRRIIELSNDEATAEWGEEPEGT